MGKENYFVRTFQSDFNTIPDDDRALVEALIRPLEPATAFFYAQMAEGFYGGLTSGNGLPTNGDSPYTVIRSNGEYRAYPYGEIEPYKGYLRDIAKRMDEAIGVAFDTRDPERDLIEATLRPRARALKEGKFAEAMILELNIRSGPRYNLFVGLLDRYLDPRGLKLVMQGWLQRIDSENNIYFNDLVHQIMGGSVQRSRIIYGDMLAAGGMTVERPWSGNTLPSEDDIRRQVGAVSYLFSNNMDQSTKEIDIPAIKKYLPQIQMSGWEEAMSKAKRNAIIAHEIGHAEMPFDEETIKLLDGRYMAVKELLAELFEVKEIAKLPRSLVHQSIKQLIYARSLARWRYYIDEYDQETDPNKRAILAHYAWAGVWRTNYQEREGGVIISEDGTMEIPNWERFVELDKNLYHELLSAISNERHQAGFVERLISLNSRKPRIYIENDNGHNSFSTRVAAA